MVKNPPAMQETQVSSLGWEDPWRREWQPTPLLWPEKSYGQRSLVQSVGPQRVRHDLVTKQQQLLLCVASLASDTHISLLLSPPNLTPGLKLTWGEGHSVLPLCSG